VQAAVDREAKNRAKPQAAKAKRFANKKPITKKKRTQKKSTDKRQPQVTVYTRPQKQLRTSTNSERNARLG
jgi:hypothetical protein